MAGFRRLFVLLLPAIWIHAQDQPLVMEVGRYEILDRTFVSESNRANAFLAVDVDVVFTFRADPGIQIRLPAFWNGKDTSGRDRFTVRFSPTQVGDWTYRTSSGQDKSLDGRRGETDRPEVIRCVPSSSPGFIQKADPYHFMYSNGERFYPVGTTGYEWIGSQSGEGPALGLVVEFLKRHFNKVRFSFMTSRLNDNAFGGKRQLSRAPENDYHWYTDVSQVDTRVINVAHWQKLDGIMHRLHEAGVHAELILTRQNPLGHQFQGNWLRGIAGRGSVGIPIGDKGLRYFVGRYAAFPRLWWCIANEYPEAALTPADITALGRQMKRLDPYGHPLTVHWNEDWLFGRQDWPSHGVVQTHVARRGLEGVYANLVSLRRKHGIGFSNDEYGYEDRGETPPNTPDVVLRAHWALVLAGGYGAYGHSPTRLTGKYMWAGTDTYWQVQGTVSPAPRSVEEVAAGQEAAPWLGHMRDWMNSGKVGYWRMAPASHLVSGSAKNAFCLALEGREYLVSGESGTVRLNLAAAAGKDLPVERLDPKTGVVQELKSTAGAPTYEFAAAADQFTIFHVGSPANFNGRYDETDPAPAERK